METRVRRVWYDRLIARPVPIQSLAMFRILFGLLMAAAMIRLLALGWVDELFVTPRFHLPYPGFDWVQPWPSFGMHLHVVLLATLAFCIAIGFYYRIVTVLFLLGFLYLELIDQTTYLNHYYLVTLLALLLVFLPANRAFSIDTLLQPHLRKGTVPIWTINLLRFQIGIVYFFAGVAKLNADWLLHAQPLRIWLPTQSNFPLIGPLLTQEWVAYGASWSGALFDLTIPFLLLFRRTRLLAFLSLAGFHICTSILFNIGMFPWIMLVGATLFFEPEWPSRWCRWKPDAVNDTSSTQAPSAFILVLIGVYLLLQMVIPLRGLMRTQPSAWTYDGFNFSWKVMIVEKAGYVLFRARDPSANEQWTIRAEELLTPRQAALMAQDPFLIRSMARQISADYRERGRPGIEVRAEAYATLNGRPSQRIIDPAANLAGLTAPGWILPLKE